MQARRLVRMLGADDMKRELSMPRTCTICHHPQQDAIAAALANGTPLRRITGMYGVALASLSRHTRRGHGGGTEPAHVAQPIDRRPAPAAIADLRRQAVALRVQAEQLNRLHRSYHEYQTDTLVVQMALGLANVIEQLWPETQDGSKAR